MCVCVRERERERRLIMYVMLFVSFVILNSISSGL